MNDHAVPCYFERMRRRLLSLAVLLACSSKPEGTISLVTGAETDVFSRQPAPTKLVVDALAPNGKTTTIAQSALPASSIDLGNQTQTDVVSLRVSGEDDNGARLVFGSSLFLAYGSLEGATFPIFVQRTGEWARMPKTLDARESPVLAILNRRSVLVAGGADASRATTATGYDLAALAPLSNTATLPRAPRSMVIENNAAVLVGDDGATSFSFTDASVASIGAPTGMTFADVAGGDAILGDDGTAYIVGATRVSTPSTSAVLVISTAGAVSLSRLLVPRLGAAAAFVPGKGLVVFGGSPTGAGAELLAPGASSATALPFKADATSGAGISLLSGSTLIVAGGADATNTSAPTRTLDLSCSTDCQLTAWNAAVPRMSVCHAYGFDGASAIVIGDDDNGATRSFKLTATSATEAPFKIARRHARSLVAPNGAVLIVGGDSDVVESYFP